jgi:hypothetical protein
MPGPAAGTKVALFLALALAGLVAGWLSTSGEKTQLVRVLDVVLFAPLLAVAGGLLLRHGLRGGGRGRVLLGAALGAALVIVGFSTAAYNARNFWAESAAR